MSKWLGRCQNTDVCVQQIFAAPISACALAPDLRAREQISGAAGRAGKRLGDPRRAPEKFARVLQQMHKAGFAREIPHPNIRSQKELHVSIFHWDFGCRSPSRHSEICCHGIWYAHPKIFEICLGKITHALGIWDLHAEIKSQRLQMPTQKMRSRAMIRLRPRDDEELETTVM